MPDFRYRKALEELRAYASLEMNKAMGRRQFHETEAYRLPRGRMRTDHEIDAQLNDRIAYEHQQIIRLIDERLPVPRGTTPLPLDVIEEQKVINDYGSEGME